MAQTKNIHIVDLSKNLMDRLQTVKLSPNYVLSKSVDINSIKKIYPRIRLGFLDVVIDCEEGVAYGHAIGPMEARIEISQIRRMN
jgi:hypothetical protein